MKRANSSPIDRLPAVGAALSAALLLGAFEAEAKPKQAPAAATEATAPPLSLEAYLSQATSRHDGYRAAETNAGAANMYVKEARVALAPSFFASATTREDRAPQFPLGIQYEAQRTNQLQMGLSQNTSFGLAGKLYYSWNDGEITGLRGFPGVSLPFRDLPRFYEGHPTAELTFSLWRNWLGEEARSQVEAAEAQARAERAQASYEADQIKFAAEAAYWRLVLAREAVKVSQEALARAEQIDSWTRRRANLQLADRSDYLQSQASVKRQQLDLRQRRDEERAATLAFNSLRGGDSLEAPEQLQEFSPEAIQALKNPRRTRERGDVAVARERSQAAQAQARLARQRDLPTLEAFGSYAMNSQQYSASEAFQQSWSTGRPTQALGVRLNAPLEFGALSDARKGREMQDAAAELSARRAAFEQDRAWDDLTQRFQEAQERLSLYRDLEDAQKTKLDYERERQRRGRTTMQQVLLFEIDYEQAQLARIGALNEINQLNAQLKLFGVTYESR